MGQAWLRIKVMDTARVTVPVGVFDTYVIRATGRTGTPDHRSYHATVWYAPAIGWFVKRASQKSVDYFNLVHIELPQRAAG